MNRFFCSLLYALCLGQGSVLAAIPQATQDQRAMQRENVLRVLIPENYDLKLHPSTELAHWRNVLWSMTLAQPSDPAAVATLGLLLDQAAVPNLGPEKPTLVLALRTASSLYLRPVQPTTRQTYSFVPEKFQAILRISRDPQVVALALAMVGQEGQAPVQPVKERLAFWFLDPQLRTTMEDLELPVSPLPPLRDLLQFQVARVPHLYLFCRSNRSVPCLALLKDGQGQFYRPEGQLWSMTLLAQSVYPLPWNFNSGETPQGLLRLEGVIPRTPAEFRAFGQFPSIKVFLPNEPGAVQFIPNLPGSTAFDLGVYRSQLPLSWQSYRPLEESFWAGRIGRTVIRIHGSGENPEFFYPQSTELPNPTIGCIAAAEQYDAKGELVRADLPQLLEAWQRVQPGDLKNLTGYLFLVEIPGSDEPVRAQEIEQAM